MSSKSNNTSYEEVNGKKRKVWRSTAATTANMMSPEAAANYLQQAAEAAAAAAAAAAGESVQITLGPNGISASSNNANANTNTASNSMEQWMNNPYARTTTMNTAPNIANSAATLSLSNLDLAALAKAGDLSALTSAAARTTQRQAKTAAAAAAGNTGTGTGSNSKDSLPCSEAEMKALMSMFVEIMGMSMDTSLLGKSTAKKKNCHKNKTSLFMDKNGWPDPAIAAATGDLDALNALGNGDSEDNDEDETDEDDSLPDLEEVQKQTANKESTTTTGASTKKKGGMPAYLASVNTNPAPVTGRNGIAPVDWESLEQVAIEDAMEAEERARKAAKRREKKTRKKDKARKEATAKATEEASKKREKAILAWRSKLVSACQSNEVSKVKTLLKESPLHQRKGATEEKNAPLILSAMTPHLEFLLPHTVAKNRNSAERGKEARSQLAHYVMDTKLPMVFRTPLRTGRPALHTACLHAEQHFVEYALKLAETWSKEGEIMSSSASLPLNYLQSTCQESGFAPLHYAVLSGSRDLLEMLLKAGADAKLKSTDTHTWRAR